MAGLADQGRLGLTRYFGEWTAGREQLLAKLWTENNLSASQIGRELHITRNAVIGKVRRLGLEHKTSSRIERKIVAPLNRKHAYPPARTRPQLQAGLRVHKPPRLKIPEPRGKPVLLVDLEPHHCRWPLGEPVAMLFCGQARAEPHPYCVFHVKRAHTPYVRST